MWFVILCSCKETFEEKKQQQQNLPPHWSYLRGVTLSRIGVCTHCRNARSTLATGATFSKCQQIAHRAAAECQPVRN